MYKYLCKVYYVQVYKNPQIPVSLQGDWKSWQSQLHGPFIVMEKSGRLMTS